MPRFACKDPSADAVTGQEPALGFSLTSIRIVRILQEIKSIRCIRALQCFSKSVFCAHDIDLPSLHFHSPKINSRALPHPTEGAFLIALWPFLNVALNKSICTQKKNL